MSKAGLDGAWTSCSAGRCPCPWNEELPKVPSTQSSPWPCNHLPCASLEVPWAAVRAQSPGEGRTGWLQRCPAGTAVLSRLCSPSLCHGPDLTAAKEETGAQGSASPASLRQVGGRKTKANPTCTHFLTSTHQKGFFWFLFCPPFILCCLRCYLT